ncbi:hypothetical protein OAO18_06880 [Francisellaceae bacterium]|nr:hypothetical protein [Francisellaceae bacterium]
MKKTIALVFGSVMGFNLAFAGTPADQSINNFFNTSATKTTQKEQLYKDVTGRDYAADLNTAGIYSEQYIQCMKIADNLHENTVRPMAYTIENNSDNLIKIYGDEQYQHIYKIVGGLLVVHEFISIACKHAPVNAIASLASNQAQLFNYWAPVSGIKPIK